MAKIPKAPKFSHTSNSKMGSGDSYGTGVKNPVGKMKSMLEPMANKKTKKPPRSLA